MRPTNHAVLPTTSKGTTTRAASETLADPPASLPADAALPSHTSGVISMFPLPIHTISPVALVRADSSAFTGFRV
ncbi:hypothetical protein JOE30_001554 [Rhodococcus sp. PvP016]|nr:hypothetical protein [Rhodococcus sp. PvP016]